jgi:hypothetical protein
MSGTTAAICPMSSSSCMSCLMRVRGKARPSFWRLRLGGDAGEAADEVGPAAEAAAAFEDADVAAAAAAPAFVDVVATSSSSKSSSSAAAAAAF